MTLQRLAATSFNGGELSPRMGGRIDTAVYNVGLATCENFVPTIEGAAVKRPGFEFIRAAAATASWATHFRFNLTQDYMLEWSNTKLRFFTNGGRIETSPGVPYEITVPYSAAEAPFVSAQQSYDKQYLAHPAYPPQVLTRTSAITFSCAPFVFKNGPFVDTNTDEAVTITASATSGSGVTLIASAAIFRAGHVGSQFRIEAKDFSDIEQWQVGLDGILVGRKLRNEGKVYQAATAGVTGTVAPTHTRGTEWDGMATGKDVNAKPASGSYGIKWTYVHDRFGIVQITAIGGGGTTATVDVIRRLPDSVTSVATFRWAYGAFSNDAGWPNVVMVSGGRLIWIKDFDICASVVGDYTNHQSTVNAGITAADLAFRRTIASENPILWAVGDRKILVGTASQEFAVGSINTALALSGDNIEAVPQSFYGTERVFPLQLGSMTLFVQRAGRKLRQAGYDFSRDRYLAENITIWARHITRPGVKQLLYQQEPEELVMAVRDDGQIIVHPHSPEQEIKGMSRIALGAGGKVVSATSVASIDGKRDELWAIVDRAGAKSVERMAEWREDGDAQPLCFYVDSGVRAIATAGQTNFTGATHLAGKAVAVLADGGVIPGIVVAPDGSFALPATSVPNYPYILNVGLPYTATLTSLRPEYKTLQGTAQSVRQRLVKLTLRLIETSGVRVGALGGILDNLIDRAASQNMDAAIPLYTGDRGRPISGGWNNDGQYSVVSDQPLPCTIVAAFPKLESGTA